MMLKFVRIGGAYQKKRQTQLSGYTGEKRRRVCRCRVVQKRKTRECEATPNNSMDVRAKQRRYQTEHHKSFFFQVFIIFFY